MDSNTPVSNTPESAPAVRVSIVPTITRLSTIITVLAGLALPITAYLIYSHYAQPESSFCDLSQKLNCSAVNQSSYAELFGIPVAILGFITYLVLFGIGLKVRKPPVLGRRGRFSHQQLLQATMGIAGLGTIFSLYLTYVEAFVLRTWCILCVTQQLIILAIFICAAAALAIIAEDVRERQVCEFC